MRKSYRVKKSKEFQAVFHRGTSTANKQFVVYRYYKQNQSHFRVGISVSKKLGNAVIRNRIKRKVRHVISEIQTELKQDVDFIVIARAPVSTMSYNEIKRSLMHVLTLSKLIKNQVDEESRFLSEKE